MTREYFKGYSDLHIPENKIPYCSSRAIVMEYIDGDRINDIPSLEKKFGDPKKAS